MKRIKRLLFVVMFFLCILSWLICLFSLAGLAYWIVTGGNLFVLIDDLFAWISIRLGLPEASMRKVL